MARLRYYGEKFKPTKGAFGGMSKFNKKLKLQAELKEKLEKMEAEKSKTKETKSKKTSTKKTDQDTNVTTETK
tara:strand:+ start:10830 stop:11048 length:219 start_codon:yes stop_codon:yes gene_type:complete